MKHIFNQTLVLMLIIGAFSCQKSSELETKKKQLADLKKVLAQTTTDISKLEKEIALIDTSVKLESNIKLVATAKLDVSDFKHFIEINGKVEADQNVNISSTMGGTITQINVKRGQKVSKGQVLGAVDNDLIVKGINELKSAQSLANTVFEKQKKLWEQQIGTELQYLQAKNNKESLDLKLQTLQKQYDMSLLKSTISGTIDEVYVKQGEMLAPGMPAIRVVNTSGLKLVADVPEGYLAKVSRGNKVLVNIPDLGSDLSTEISSVSEVISPLTRTFRIEMPLKGAMNNYKANMMAYLKIEDFKKTNTIVVPINLVERQEDKDYVFLAKANKAQKKEVKLGRIYKNDAEIISGLSKGDIIITKGYQDLVDGQTIKF